MIKILYFAWLRTRIGTGVEEVEPPAGTADVRALIAWLASRSAAHAEALANTEVIKAAVNQEHVAHDHPIRPGDEVALFPPVTGG